MTTALTIVENSLPAVGDRYAARVANDAALSPVQRLAEWFAGMTPQTRRAYRGDLYRFAQWLGVAAEADKSEAAVGSAVGAALDLAAHADRVDTAPRPTLRMLERYRDELYGDGTTGLRSTTVMRSIAAINSALTMLAKAGIGLGAQDVSPPIRNTVKGSRKGPRQQTVAAMLARLEQSGDDAASVRDAAIVSLLARCALRRGELVSLDVTDYDASECRVAVLGKGRKAPEWMAINDTTCAALQAWIALRPRVAAVDETALFVGLSNHMHGHRLSGEAVRLIVGRAAKGVSRPGETVRPHGLRHTAATVIIEHSNGNLALAQHALRHANIRTTSAAYDDSGERSQRTAIDLLGKLL